MLNAPRPSSIVDGPIAENIFATPAAEALAAVIAEGARLFIAEPWRIARVVRGADALTIEGLGAHLARRRRAGPPADLNLAIALAQLNRALQAPQFCAVWADWRAARSAQ